MYGLYSRESRAAYDGLCTVYQTKHDCKFYHSKIEIQTHFSQKVYKLSKAKPSHFDRTREGKNQIFPT